MDKQTEGETHTSDPIKLSLLFFWGTDPKTNGWCKNVDTS